jgi:hypothetical protein
VVERGCTPPSSRCHYGASHPQRSVLILLLLQAEGRAEALTAPYAAVKQSAAEVQRIVANLPHQADPNAASIRQVPHSDGRLANRNTS